MKKLSKILVSVLSSFAFLCAPLFLVGCSGNNLSITEVNEVQGKAAEAYFSTHTEIPTYADTTYHWKKNSTTNTTVTLNYKKNAADTEKVDGDFENKDTTAEELTIAVKKFGDNLICKLVYSNTTTSDSYSVNPDDQTAKHTVSTIVTTRTYRLYTYVASNIVNYVLLCDASSKVDNEDADVTKEKVVLTEADYNDLVTTVLKKTNDAIKGYFFDSMGILISYKDFAIAQRNGDQVTVGINYDDLITVDDHNYTIRRFSNNFKSIFENDKVSKVTSATKMTSKRLSSQAESNFDITNSAEVDTISDISAYDLSVNTYYFEAILSSLPTIPMIIA